MTHIFVQKRQTSLSIIPTPGSEKGYEKAKGHRPRSLFISSSFVASHSSIPLPTIFSGPTSNML